MRLSARNQISGKVRRIEKGAIISFVEIEVAPDIVITASIANESVAELGLEAGTNAIAVMKASSVMINLKD